MRTMREIAEEVGRQHGLQQYEMWSTLRWKPRVMARQRAFYEMAKEGHLVADIARTFQRSHVTVLHGMAKHADRNGLEPLRHYDLQKKIETSRKTAIKHWKRKKNALD